MARYFTEQEIDCFFEVWLGDFPNALQEKFRVLRNPDHPRNRRLLSNSIGEMRKTAEKLDFYKAYKKDREFAFLDLQKDVMDRVRSLFESKETPIMPYTNDEIDDVLRALIDAYPNFAYQASFEMRHPFPHIAVPDSRSLGKLRDIAISFGWFSNVVDRETSAIFRLHFQLMRKLATDAGLIDLDEDQYQTDFTRILTK